MDNLLVIDGNSIVNRAFYGVKALSNSKGLYTNAIFGMTNIILKYLDKLSPKYAAVAFDLPAPTFRHKYYTEYKAGRRAMPEELAMQMPYAKKMCEMLGLKVLEREGFEADDILGTLASAADGNTFTYLLTGDRDSLQLVNEKTHVILARNTGDEDVGPEEFFAMYGVKPEQFVDMKAIMGDKSDNIPGVAGIGEKGAGVLISTFGSLDGVYESIDSDKISEKVREKLIAGKDDAYMSKYLAKIVTDAPVTGEDITYKEIDREALYEFALELEFTALIKKLDLSPSSKTEQVSVTECDAADLPRGDVAVNIRDDGIEVCDGEKVFFAKADDAFISSYIFRQGRRVYLFDGKSILHKLSDEGFDREDNPDWVDLLLLSYIANSNEKADFEKLCQVYLKRPASDCVSYDIYNLCLTLIEQLKTEGQFEIFEKIEQPLSFILFDMEKRGFRVDKAGLEKFGGELESACGALQEGIYFLSGEVFNINSPKQLGTVLFEKLGLPAPKKGKTGGYSTNAEVLEKLMPYSPVIEKILDYRQLSKFKSTYADGLAEAADGEGRVHTTFKQTVAATGRLSSTEPNLQNIPVRTELGREFRKYFIADEGKVLIDADYSQIELRILAAVSGDERMTEHFLSGEDIHTKTASAVFGIPLEAVTPELRKKAKAVNFGIVYGIGDFSLAQDIGVSRAEAKKYIESYKANYPEISAYLAEAIASAYKNGYVTTMFGRRRYIPELKASNKIQRSFGERVAMNSPIQGSAADLIKIAMINTEKALREAKINARLILQVHDELIVESDESCAEVAEKILKEEMENAVKLKVPLSVSISSGKNWGEAH